jgi:hypothetical protein
MDKKDLKKLALLGIAGALIASPGPVKADEASTEIVSGMLAGGCGGSSGLHSCSSRNSCQSSMGGSGCAHRNGCGGSTSRDDLAEADENPMKDTGQMMTEDQLMSQLNEQGKQMYNNLNPEGKAMAIKLASGACKGQNDCKGQGSCKTADHACAGKNSCAGKSQCSFKDKNLAVKVAAQLQATKRAQASGASSSGSY